MICTRCKNSPAIYHDRIVRNGMVSERFLCKECYAEVGFQQPMFGALSSMLSSLGNAGKQSPIKVNLESATKCLTCGCTSGDYLGSGYVGCAKCYEAFAPMMETAISRLQKSMKHTGKVPDKISEREMEIARLTRLRDTAASAEEFLEAHRLNELINKLKEGKSDEK